jgi:hypothetical protein
VSAPEDKVTYTVRARRWKRGWELHIENVGVTQSRTLNDAEAMAREYVALDTGADSASFCVEILPEVGGSLDEEARAARHAVKDAERAQRDAANLSRDVARKLKGEGLTGREIAVVLKVSPQRVSQLLGGALRDTMRLHGGAGAWRDLSRAQTVSWPVTRGRRAAPAMPTASEAVPAVYAVTAAQCPPRRKASAPAPGRGGRNAGASQRR